MDYYILTPISFVLRVFEVFAQFAVVLAMTDKKAFDKKHIVGAIIFSAIFEFAKYITPDDANGFLSIALGIPFISIYFREKIWKTSVIYLVTGIIVALIDFVAVLTVSSLLNVEILKIADEFPLYVLCSIVVSLGLLLISRLISNKEWYKSFKLQNKSIVGLINGISAFLLLIPNLVMLVYYHDGKNIPLIIIIVNILAIIAMFFVTTYNMKKGFELVTAEQELVTQKTYNKTLQNLVDGLRTFKHDYNNTLQTMYGYIQLDNMTGLREFFEQILDESRAITALDKLNPDLFKNPSLFGLITAKYEYARQNNVNINFEMYGKLENADMQIYDLTRTLGIFLDNAIEASAGSDKKKVNFMVCERKGKVIIEIINSYSETGLKIENLNDKGISSKGENRGLGLYKVKEILKKYLDVKHETTASNGMFMQRLTISKIKENAKQKC